MCSCAFMFGLSSVICEQLKAKNCHTPQNALMSQVNPLCLSLLSGMCRCVGEGMCVPVYAYKSNRYKIFL